MHKAGNNSCSSLPLIHGEINFELYWILLPKTDRPEIVRWKTVIPYEDSTREWMVGIVIVVADRACRQMKRSPLLLGSRSSTADMSLNSFFTLIMCITLWDTSAYQIS
ncbi:hypothetical protein NPIL_569001 [Nephila pilipes]|uniref:Uncharacterized protein n=1 Tax=Nephila pilipes TaxID=299642 RepID=A0A8X6Q4A6_NEPPI|nr:hypothetical protein NPIL_569001 [Nephila pilipes]